MFLSAPFADGALVTPPALLKDHLGHPHVDAVGMVALTTLGGDNNILVTNTLEILCFRIDRFFNLAWRHLAVSFFLATKGTDDECFLKFSSEVY